MQLIELKKMPVEQLIELGEECGIENASRAKRQDIVFGILKSKAKNGEDIEGEGVLEILQDGFGFLRSPDSSYLAGPDDNVEKFFTIERPRILQYPLSAYSQQQKGRSLKPFLCLEGR